MSRPAGQWKYAQDSMKLQWATEADSVKLLGQLSSNRQLSASAADGQAAVTEPAVAKCVELDVLAEPPVDPVTGKLPLLRDAE